MGFRAGEVNQRVKGLTVFQFQSEAVINTVTKNGVGSDCLTYASGHSPS